MIRDLWEAWCAHPDYHEAESPACVGVFTHPPGRGGHVESYIIGDFQGVLANVRWGERKLGDFAGIVPVWADIPVDPFFITVISTSLKSKAARAKAARDELKRLLPPKLRPLVSLARKANARRKGAFLKIGEESTKLTKRELFLARWLNAATRAELEVYIALDDFWRCATGRVHPFEVADLITHQLPLISEEGEP